MTKKEIIKDLARKHKLSYEQVEEAVQSQPKCVAHVFRKGKGESIRLPYFGKFFISDYRLKKLKENNNGQGLRQLTS